MRGAGSTRFLLKPSAIWRKRQYPDGRPRHRHGHLPDAPVKIFLTASAQSRAERRYKELIEKGQQVTMDGILHDINERDRQDMTRAVAPLKQADDAVLLDTSSLTLEESIAAVLRIIREKTEEKA
ncbi:MAG: (d)CMP kinase [Butyricicoccus sp.]